MGRRRAGDSVEIDPWSGVLVDGAPAVVLQKVHQREDDTMTARHVVTMALLTGQALCLLALGRRLRGSAHLLRR